VVAGTRPEAIKMAPVLAALEARGDEVEARLVLTGQHTDMVHEVLRRFELEADRDLALMTPGQSLYDVAHGVLDGLRHEVRATGAHALLVQGDTATVAFGALVGFLERIWVGHVEAGLRSGDPDAPWPEENFRRMTDVLSRGFFAPTPAAAANLRRENHPADAIHVTGNTVVDALLRVAAEGEPGAHRFRDGTLGAAVEQCRREGRPLVLMTAHRRESFGAPLERVFRGVRELAAQERDAVVVYPVHPNPRVREPAMAALAGLERVHLTGPVDYFDLVHALRAAALVLTDSGGIQEEAPTFGTPVLVLREVTERPEGVEAGVAELVGTDPGALVRRAAVHLAAWRRRAGPGEGGRGRPGSRVLPTGGVGNPYGDGRAGERIADLTLHHLTGVPRRTADWTPPHRSTGGEGRR
jgi:UDP-N-acetylglucosamine 2-epimerase